MMKIGTHNSASKEKPYWWDLLSWLIIPFARTQSKTIKEQISSGVRMFDLRAKLINGEYRVAHGLYKTKRTLSSFLNQINEVDEPVYVSLAYEGRLSTDETMTRFKKYIENAKNTYKNITWGPIHVKYTNSDIKVDWVLIEPADPGYPKYEEKYLGLNGKRWQSFIPIPWLWKKIYFNHPKFNEEYYTIVDFY